MLMVDDLGMSHPHDIHDRINALCAQARRLAPKVADQALDSCCTTDRPAGPRQAKAWDLVQEAFALNETTVAEETPAHDPRCEKPADHAGFCYWVETTDNEETNDMTHYAEASQHEPLVVPTVCVHDVPLTDPCPLCPEASQFRPVSARENLERMDREGAEGETSGPLFVHGYSLSEAIDVAQETGRRFVVRSHAGTQWATNTLATGYPGDDVILWCASDALGEALNHGNEA